MSSTNKQTQHLLRTSFIAILLMLLTSCLASDNISGKVVGVLDGDTIEVLQNKQTHRIRLHGIDAPEKGQDFGTQAKKAASDLAFNKNVTVSVTTKDRYNRSVGIVTLSDGKILNLVSVTSPAKTGSTSTIVLQTVPNASCTITVIYKSGPSKARGLEPKVVDSNGKISWSWVVGTNTTPGTWPIIVTSKWQNGSDKLSASFKVEK